MLVQFGNNWIQKIPWTAKFGSPWNFSHPIFPNWTACSPITYTKRLSNFSSSFPLFKFS